MEVNAEGEENDRRECKQVRSWLRLRSAQTRRKEPVSVSREAAKVKNEEERVRSGELGLKRPKGKKTL